jgi:hypothetical protein
MTKRLFRHLPLKERAFVQNEMDVNVSNQKSRQESNTENNAYNKIINSQDIMNSIDSSYDTTIEVLNKVSQTVNKTAEAISSIQASQVNYINLKYAHLEGTTLTATQTNSALITVTLTATLKFISELDADNKTKAVVADMLGVSQSTDAVQQVIQDIAQVAQSAQDAKEDAEQSRESMCGFGLLCNSLAVNVSNQDIEQITNLTNTVDNLEDNSIRNQSIQNYVTTLRQKVEKENTFVDNIKQTIQAIAEQNQNNTLDVEGLSAKDTVIKFNQSNELTSEIVHGFQELMEDVKEVVGEVETDITQKIEGGQKTYSKQTGEQGADQDAESDQTASAESLQKQVSLYVIIVIAVAVVLGLGVLARVLIAKKT